MNTGTVAAKGRRRPASRSLLARGPGHVVARGSPPLPPGQLRTRRPVRVRRAVLILHWRLLPCLRLVVLLARREIDVVAEPAAAARRHLRGVGVAVIDHPAPLGADRAVDEG